MHERILPETVFEPVKGLYAQVIACAEGKRYEVAGTLPYHSDGSLDLDLPTQCKVMMENVQASLDSIGARREDVVRIRVFTTRMDHFLSSSMDIVFGWFGDQRPTSTLVEVNRLANAHIQVEMDAEVVVPAERVKADA